MNANETLNLISSLWLPWKFQGKESYFGLCHLRILFVDCYHPLRHSLTRSFPRATNFEEHLLQTNSYQFILVVGVNLFLWVYIEDWARDEEASVWSGTIQQKLPERANFIGMMTQIVLNKNGKSPIAGIIVYRCAFLKDSHLIYCVATIVPRHLRLDHNKLYVL